MSFQTLLNQDRDKIFLNKSEFAQDVTYTPDGGTTKSIVARLGVDIELVEEGQRGRISSRSMAIIISTDATAGIASPNMDDTVTINGEIWAIAKIFKSIGIAELGLVRITELDKGVRGI